MRVRSSSQHQFSRVPRANIQRSLFVRSHTYKTTFNEGYLIPFYCDEALPGDTFNLKATLFARLATPETPYMDNLYLTTFYFDVPLRQIWNNFQKFMGEQDNPGDSTSYLVPVLNKAVAPLSTTGVLEQTLLDYMGVPIKKTGLDLDAFWTRAYNWIWNNWFRDQNMQNSVTVDKGDGPDNPANYVLLKRGKRHDYFTSALPFVQKGPAVPLPLTGNAPVITNNQTLAWRTNTTDPNTDRQVTLFDTAADYIGLVGGAAPVGNQGVHWGQQSGLIADLSAVTAATINQLRQAATLQQFYELDARGGTRYIEIVLSHFNVVGDDLRFQRPEYLGGTTVPLQVSVVPQTSSTDATTPQGNLAAFATATMHGNRNGFVKSFTEHSVVIGLLCVHADLTYQQGLNRMWSRQTRVDFYWPTFAHLGEQAILNKEIYAQGTSADNDVFGYQERYAEYRYKPSLITGLFRSGATGTLDYWHLSQNFLSLPTLGSTFIQESPPVDRIVAVPSQPHFLLDSHIELKCARPMPVYSVPGIQRF